MQPKASVIIPTYNWPEALILALRSLEAQTVTNFEIIIADDGSTDETRQAIELFKQKAKLTIKHLWQADEGFQAAKARNKAAALATGELLIFIDGDCLVPPNFIAKQLQLAEPGWFLAGNRVLLSQAFTEEVIFRKLPVFNYGLKQWWQLARSTKVNRWFTLLSLPLGPLRKVGSTQWKKCRTCNLAVWREDFIEVNGFDENYMGWGYEDSDLVVRLLRHGIRRKSSKHAATVLHLWHREFDRSREPENLKKLQTILQTHHQKAKLGLDRYLG